MFIMDLIEIRRNAVNKRQSKKKLQDIMIGVTLGFTVGLVGGLLLAPKPGRETREDITKAAKQLPVKAKGVLGNAKEKVKDTKAKLKETKVKFSEKKEA